MKVLILGIDGYLGWPLANYLAARNHEVAGVDALYRREFVNEMGSISAIPISSIFDRRRAFRDRWVTNLPVWEFDIGITNLVQIPIKDFKPDAIVHLAENPSAAYSMKSAGHAVQVQGNNVLGTIKLLFAMRDICPDAHLIKLGTMGEYGTPNVDIPEGYFEIEYRGRKDRLPFPKQAGSFYHLTKVHDTNNIAFACKIWGLRATDLMQGVVYGSRIEELGDDPRLATRLDFDEAFGTVINRFCCQALLGEPITIYGKGLQTRGFIPLKDSMECIALTIENPAEPFEHRIFNQFEWIYTINYLAETVKKNAEQLGAKPRIEHIENPRIEAEEHYYNPDRLGLIELGYSPDPDSTEVLNATIKNILMDLVHHGERIAAYRQVLMPKIKWSG